MGNLLEQGAQWLHQQQRQFLSSPVTYRRAVDDQELQVLAVFGQTRYESIDESGLTVQSIVWDFLIGVADLPFRPAVGDQILAAGFRYEIMRFGDQLHGWRYSDPYRQIYRIHTRQIGIEP